MYIYSHPQKPAQLYARLIIRPLGQQAYHVDYRNYKILFCNSRNSVRLFTFLYPIGYQSAQFFRRALHYASGSRKFFRQSAQPPWGSVYVICQPIFLSHLPLSLYIYIYMCVCVCVCEFV